MIDEHEASAEAEKRRAGDAPEVGERCPEVGAEVRPAAPGAIARPVGGAAVAA